MNRLIDLDLRAGTIWLSCPWDPQAVGTIKTIPGREYDAPTKRWSVPLAEVALVIHRLEPLHFRFTPRMRDWWAENRDELPTAPPAPDPLEVDPADGYTVSRLNEEARRALTAHFGEVWIVAEIDGFDRNKPDNHAYFELVERTAGGAEAIARVRAVMFAATRRRIEQELPGDIALRDGLRVRFRGKVELYAPSGSYQLVIEAIDVEWAIGSRRRKRDEVLEKLRAEGLADLNVARPLPLLPLRVGLITAAHSEAYNDFVHELERSGIGFHLTVCDARMQGRDAEASVLSALTWFAQASARFDVLVVTRGGGSQGDLSSFDSLAIGRAVCELPIKVIAGIGHHRDQSVLDFVATSEKTPTAAAQALVAQVQRAISRVDDAGRAAAHASRRVLDASTRRVSEATTTCERAVNRRLNAASRRIDQAASACARSTTLRLVAASRHVDRASVRVAERGAKSLELAGQRVQMAWQSIDRAVTGSFRQRDLQLSHVEAKLRLADPRRVIERGYAIVRDGEGRVVTDAAALREMESARLEMRDGMVEVIPVESTHE